MSETPKDDEKYTEEEANRRFEATLRGALKTPPQKHPRPSGGGLGVSSAQEKSERKGKKPKA